MVRSIRVVRMGVASTRKLLAQVCQRLFNRLHLLLQLAQIGFQSRSPFGLRLEPALEMVAFAIAASTTVALTATFIPALARAAGFLAAATFLIVVRIPTTTHCLTPFIWKTVLVFRQEIVQSLAGLSDTDYPGMQMVQPQVGQPTYAPGRAGVPGIPG
jgi:hypothetical protein